MTNLTRLCLEIQAFTGCALAAGAGYTLYHHGSAWVALGLGVLGTLNATFFVAVKT